MDAAEVALSLLTGLLWAGVVILAVIVVLIGVLADKKRQERRPRPFKKTRHGHDRDVPPGP